MNTIEKLKVIEELDSKPIITKIGNQSIQMFFDCGCTKIQHGYSGNNGRREFKKSVEADRFFYITLCKKHTN